MTEPATASTDTATEGRMVPPGATDCHLHVIGPKARFPLAPDRAYTPVDAPLEDLVAAQDRLGLDRLVLVQTSIFGTDNACMLDALERLGPERARAVAVPAADLPGSELDRWHALGVRGVRLNLTSNGVPGPEAIREAIAATVPQCARNGWHIQFFLPGHVYPGIEADLAALPVPAVLDHFAMIPVEAPPEGAEDAVKRMLGGGNVWVKVSGSYRIATDIADPRIGALAQRLAEANADRLVWGSDWPHTPAHGGKITDHSVELPYREMDTEALLRSVQAWFEGPLARSVLVDNPARLYGF